MRKLVYYVAVSLDGYIAGPNGEYDFYPLADDMHDFVNKRYPEAVPTHIRPNFGIALDTPNQAWDAIIMGRGSYDPAYLNGVTSPYAHLDQYVVSTTLDAVDDPAIHLVNSDPVGLVQRLKKQEGKDIYLCGGGNLAGQLLAEIDQLIIKSYPVIAGSGVPMLAGNFDPTQFEVTRREVFSQGAQITWLTRR